MSRGEKIGARMVYLGFALPVVAPVAAFLLIVIVSKIIHLAPASASAVIVGWALMFSFPVGFCLALTGGVVMAVSRKNP